MTTLLPSRSMASRGNDTVVTRTTELFAAFASTCAALTVAVFVRTRGPTPAPLMVTVAVPPAASEPRLTLTVPAPVLKLPWLTITEPKTKLAGNVSVRLTAVAVAGPALATVNT
jgi:hypothetical protein